VQASPTISALATALSAAQGELADAAKSSENPHFRSKYADLAEVLQTLRPILSKHGLALVQTPGAFLDGRICVTTSLLHSSGEYLSDTLQLPVVKADPQGVGAAITYARRYAAAAICGIAQDDDDGETASGRGGKASAKTGTKSAPPTPGPVSVDGLIAQFQSAGDSSALAKLGASFAALSAQDQGKVLPHAKAARERISQ
jgi:hypothetical protein